MSKPEQILKVKDYGIPNMSSHRKGDMFLILNPNFPKKITEEQKSILQLYKKSV
jgi:DnaJ-class molecular chaperone